MNDYKYTCIVDTTYTLSLYLLYKNMPDIEQTLFFVGNAIPMNICEKLPHVVKMNNSVNKYNSRWKWVCRRLEAVLRWRDRHKSIFFAQDHLLFSGHLIGRHPYILLEDAPNIYTQYKSIDFMKPVLPKSWIYEIRDYILFGSIGRRILGTNVQCYDTLVTKENDLKSELLNGRKVTLVSMEGLWNNSEKEKKAFIRSVFSISDSLFSLSKECSVIIFSQPLMDDCKLAEDEVVKIFSPYINQYKNQGIIIKPHPRDKFDYLRYFPGVKIMDTKAPMQLLSAMGFHFKTAITVCSSAVSSMPESTEIIWIGSKVNKKVFKVYGDLKSPR